MNGNARLARLTDGTHSTTSAEAHFRVFMWMDAHLALPHWRQVASHFGVDRATAFRWLSAYRSAKGIA